MAGRPRGVDDVVILRAAAEVIGRVGPAGFTLAAVAGEVGLVPGTLVQRFGSKRGLLLALADRSVADAAELSAGLRPEHPSALAALVAAQVGWAAPMATPESFANHLAFLCTDLTDPQLHERALAVHRAQRGVVEALLTEAVHAGELLGGTDVPVLAGTVQAITAGAGLTWALERDGTLAERLRRELDAVLAPHVPPRHDHDLEGS
ncbi:TetR family transcriptional regulator [Kitasatospora herbaricolor]|uniref:TetR/AcrR family transcriptional regulator n=1 Tax=Kitasatospora herbaricolor TaxID=68217 RepID=UPI00174DA50B|nr:TetR/AcrR family transcriptional regulator [Kitasatospora herbaricolor]MDQ0313231.1 AcrR family transcriptional regulator [Kitasatospora herbaricolor]GGV20361.1 TetR family transcriptional regulator [Kitasatospora herbaricolor]